MIQSIVEVCLIPILGILVKYLVSFLTAKAEELKAKTDSEVLQKYIELATETVTTCVIATNQTYVNSLKATGSFDEEAQKTALETTMNAVLVILSEEAKTYLTEITGDIEVYLTNLIEAEVNKNRE